MAHRFCPFFGRKSRILGRGPRRGSFYSFISYSIFFYFWAEQQWRIVWLGKISEKTYLKEGIIAEIQRSLLIEIRYSRSSYFTNLNSNLSAVQKYDILVTKPLQAAGMSDDKVCG